MTIETYDDFLNLVKVFVGLRIAQTSEEVRLMMWMIDHDPELQNLQIPESLKEPPFHLLP